MKKLQSRARPDTLTNELRPRRKAASRWLYLGALGLLALWVGDLLFGGFIFLRSDGIVLAPSVTVSTEFVGTVRNLNVHEGDAVKQGQSVGAVSSHSVVEGIARNTLDAVNLRSKIFDLKTRGEIIDAVLYLAAERSKSASDAQKTIKSLADQKILALDFRTAAVDAQYRSRYDAASLEVERDATAAELSFLEPAVRQAEAAIADLRSLYANGKLVAPISGIVGRLHAVPGSVFQPGQPLMEIYSQARYVLAYLPTGTVYQVEIGDPVTIRWGLRALKGKVIRIEPIAASLPSEFQQAFKPVDRAQVIRVAFEAGADPPPLFTKVRLRAGFSFW